MAGIQYRYGSAAGAGYLVSVWQRGWCRVPGWAAAGREVLT